MFKDDLLGRRGSSVMIGAVFDVPEVLSEGSRFRRAAGPWTILRVFPVTVR